MSQSRFEYSAGGVVVDEDRVLLVRTTNLRGKPVWTFPKGLLEAGEHSPQAALREVQEETGYACEIVRELPRSTYWYRRAGGVVCKTVRWFLMRPVQRVGTPDTEIDEVAWYPLSEAPQHLSYASDRALIQAVWPAVTASDSQTRSLETNAVPRGVSSHR
jgi:8-oxo-dGTP pyrophosphatase MutT (NUDIX family)